MSNNNSGPDWEITRETDEGVLLEISDGENVFDVVPGGVGVYDVRDGEGESVCTLIED